MKISQDALTFDDVLLVPGFSEVLPHEANLATKIADTISLSIPLLSAAMDTVTEGRLAIALAQEGGMGIIHKNMSVADQIAEVKRVKKFESGVVKNPITVTPCTTVKELLALTKAHNISGVPVVVGDNLVGIVTARDMRFESSLEQPVENIMTPKAQLITVREGASRAEVIRLLHKHRIEKLLIVNEANELRGLITVKDMQKAQENPIACKDILERLRVGAAIGVDDASLDRAYALIEAGVDVLVVDTAHGHSRGVIMQVDRIKREFPRFTVMAGNIATADAAKALADVGTDAVKVGIGPGSICTTRIVTGVGLPQLTAIANVVEALQATSVKIIADGGIRFSGDVAKAIAAGAHAVMIGSLLAGTEEAPGELELYQGRSYKSYRGMGSLSAMAQNYGSSERYNQPHQRREKLVPEGIEGRVPFKGTLSAIVHQLMGGLRSSMGYTGAGTIEDLRTKAQFVRITPAGMKESHVHDVSITKESPNYWVQG